mgnify:CR=1 FL=1
MNESRTWTQYEIDSRIAAMVDERVKARQWTKNDVLSFIAAVGTVLCSLLTIWVGREAVHVGRVAEAVSDRQAVHEQKTADAKAAIEVESAAMARKLERIEKATSSVESRIQVMGSARPPQ